MKVSVYAIYVIACLLACGAATLSGVVLIDTFNKQQQVSEKAQQTTGLGQVSSMQTVIEKQMARMQTATDANARVVFHHASTMSDDVFEPDNVIAAFNDTVFSNWVLSLPAPNQLDGFGLTFVYTNATTGTIYDRGFEAYWYLQLSGEYVYIFSASSNEDGLLHASNISWENYSTPLLDTEVYIYDSDVVVSDTYMKDDFFYVAKPWVSEDGNSYWYFTHLRSFQRNGVQISFQTWDVATAWLDMMKGILTEEANFVAFDSQKYVLAATNADELRRLQNCRGSYEDGNLVVDCINFPADQHPTKEIRDIYTFLHTPSWDDLTAGPIAPTMTKLSLSGKQHMVISSTLFSKDDLRTIIVWYQPWVTLQSDSVALTALICILTVVSTFLLTLLGVFGVLRPLMELGGAMRTVANTLKEGDGEREAVLEPRKPSAFREVDAIGKDFETIVVDFLGFSSVNARDNKYAPKVADKPFAVIFTDIQSSTELWGRDPAEMSRSLQAHHRLIRELIQKHCLYEVKTVGDSFMVTTTSAQDALLFALDLQTKFHEHDWDWDEMEDLYRETTLAFNKSTTGLLSEYDEVWNGLRVRIGAHYGTGKVTYDEVTKGYDYYGTVVNTAARIEAVTHGGQVIVSQDLMKALPAPLDPSVGLAILLGAVPLRGVVEPPALVEVKPTSLQGRKFPPLRVDADKVPLAEPLPWDSAAFVSSPNHRDRELHGSPSHRELQGYSGSRRLSTGSSHNSNGSMATHTLEELARSHTMVQNGLLSPELLSHHLLALYHIVEDLLKPLAPQQHTTVAKALATGWGVPPPKGKLDFGNTAVRLVHRMSETTRVLCHFQPPPPPTAHSLVPAPCPLPTTQSLQGISYSTVSMLSH